MMYAVHKTSLALMATLCVTTHATVHPEAETKIKSWIKSARKEWYREKYPNAKDCVLDEDNNTLSADMKQKLGETASAILQSYEKVSSRVDDTSRAEQYLYALSSDIPKPIRKPTRSHIQFTGPPWNKWVQELLNFLEAEFKNTRSAPKDVNGTEKTEATGDGSRSSSRSPSPSTATSKPEDPAEQETMSFEKFRENHIPKYFSELLSDTSRQNKRAVIKNSRADMVNMEASEVEKLLAWVRDQASNYKNGITELIRDARARGFSNEKFDDQVECNKCYPTLLGMVRIAARDHKKANEH